MRILLALALAITPTLTLAQNTGGASVMVTDISSGDILAANNIDAQTPANMAGRLAFKLLAHEWADINAIAPTTLLPNTNGLTLETGLQKMLEDGQTGEMARASMAGLIGYTPQSLGNAVSQLLNEMGITTQNFTIQRSQFNGPEWAGTISLRDMGRIATSLTRLHGTSINQTASGADLQCFSYGIGAKTSTPMISVVSGAASPQGCLAAANSAIELSDTRLDGREKIIAETPDTN